MIDFTSQEELQLEINRLASIDDWAGIEKLTEGFFAYWKQYLLDSGCTEQDWEDMLHRVCPPTKPYPIQVELKIQK